MASISYSPNEIIALGAILPVVCGAVVACRFYARKKRGSYLGADDWLIIPGYLCLLGMCVSIIAGAAMGGLGQLTPKQTDALGSSYSKRITREVFWATELLQILSLGFVKSSFLFLYRRIFITRQTSSVGIFNIANIAMIVIVSMWTVGFFFAYIFLCGTNFWAYYGSSQAYEIANCVKTTILNNSFAISDMLTDLIIILMPIPLVVRLQMTTRRKLAVIGIFLLGGLTLATSIIRMVIYIESDAVLFGGHVDVDMLTSGTIYWSTLESGIGMIAACLPILYRSFKSSGLESIVRSVRSAVSLRSLSTRNSSNRSKGSQVSKTAVTKKAADDADSQASNASIVHANYFAEATTENNEHELAQIGHGYSNQFSAGIGHASSGGPTSDDQRIVIQQSFAVHGSPA